MINELIKNLQRYNAAYSILIQKYPSTFTPDIYEDARKGIQERAPYKTEQFFKTLNVFEGGSFYPEKGLTYESMIAILSENKERIERAIEMSKSAKEMQTLSGPKLFIIHHSLKTAIKQIDQAGDFSAELLRGAQSFDENT